MADCNHLAYAIGHSMLTRSGGGPYMRSMGQFISCPNTSKFGVHLVLACTDARYTIIKYGN